MLTNDQEWRDENQRTDRYADQEAEAEARN